MSRRDPQLLAGLDLRESTFTFAPRILREQVANEVGPGPAANRTTLAPASRNQLLHVNLGVVRLRSLGREHVKGVRRLRFPLIVGGRVSSPGRTHGFSARRRFSSRSRLEEIVRFIRGAEAQES
jgi:hypothetical protein